MDQWRILLVDLVYLLNSSFRDAHYWEGVKAEKDTIRKFVNILHELNQMPGHDGSVRIVFRGSSGSKLDSKFDYVIRFGKLNVDIGAIAAVIKRMGIRMKHIEGRLTQAFEALASQGFDTMFLKIPDSSNADLEKMQICLRIISCYKKALRDDNPVNFTKDGAKRSVTPILNEAEQPDPNLTMVAALNDLSPKHMLDMVQKVSALMQRPDFARAGIQSANAYQTIFNIESLRQRLHRPLIEVNSTRPAQGRLDQQVGPGGGVERGPGGAGGVAGAGPGRAGGVAGAGPGRAGGVAGAGPGRAGGVAGTGPGRAGGVAGAGPGGASGAGGPDIGQGPAVAGISSGADGVEGVPTAATPAAPTAVIEPADLKASVARFVKKTYGESPETATGVMKSIYSSDYSQLDPTGLEGRLQLITDLLTSLQNNEQGQQVMEEVVQRIQAGVDQVPKDVLDDLVVQDDVIKIWDGEDEKIVGKADEKILDIIETSKERANTRKKMRAALRPETDFTEEDIDQLSKTFDISVSEAEEIVKLFKACFDGKNNFQKALFEKKAPEFAKYPKRVFEVLWEFLRETPRRSDRLPLLNSLQFLMNEIKQPKQAIKVLLSDFLVDAAEVRFPDRNAMMLATLFLRTYNKEINMDIEITPEEVLLVQVGMDERVRHYAAWKVDGEQKKFVEKVITIRKKLFEALESDGSEAGVLPVRFLLALEREVHMFLALVGGKTAAAVLKSALKFYGNPQSQVYLLKESRHYTSSLLQHLAVLIRGIGRIGHPADFELLDEINSRQSMFLGLSEESRHAAQVRRTVGWIDAAKREISSRTDNN
jgi:hypothetical protein